MATKKVFVQIILGVFMLSFVIAACNNGGEKKETTDSTTMKSDSVTSPMMDTTKMADTTNKMDTGKTKPVSPGN